MTGNKDLMSEIIIYKGSTITFGDNFKDHGIKHELSAARSPQQNSVAERRNRTLKEAARTMLTESGISQRFWADAVNTACYTQNRSMLNKNHEKTPHEIWTGKQPEVGYFRIFGYSAVRKAYRAYNQRTLTVEESIHIVFDESSIFHDNTNSSIHDLINNLDSTNLEASSEDEVDLRRTVGSISKENPTAQEQTQQVNEPEDNQQPQNIEGTLEQEEEIIQSTEINSYGPCLQWKKDHPLELVIGLQVKQSENGIFINQVKYTRDMLKKFGMENCSPASTPMSSSIKLNKDEWGISVDTKMYRGLIDSSLNLVGYSDADYAGCKVDTKSTSGSCQFLGERLISWLSKKQTSITTSITEAEYLAVGNCCAQMLWIQRQLKDYGIPAIESPIFCDNTSAIAITYNPAMHSRTKHIDIRHHFIRVHVMKKEIRLEYVHTDKQTADIFTKPLPEAKFSHFRNMLGLIDIS
ncbi:uncharacterized protein LOC142530542 [Primulina tabacum]|uniref:uncharacterized protein LOC142530542 n=1 Tax=Primulina tabacum TaxID=48773 RepID=UPI003F590434